MLVVMAALLLQSLVRLQQVPLGFEPGGAMTARVSIPGVKYPDAAAKLEFQRTLLRIARNAAVGPGSRFHDQRAICPRSAPGSDAPRPCGGGGSSQPSASAVEQVVSPGLFRALGVTLLAGREFGAQDQPGSPLVAIVSEGLARRLWARDGRRRPSARVRRPQP